MSDSTIYLLLFPVVRTVAEGHRMVAQGWVLFKEAMETAGAGDLPQLLCHLRGVATPTLSPVPAPVPIDVQPQQGAAAEPNIAAQSPVKQEGEELVVVVVGGMKMGLSSVQHCEGVEEWLQCPHKVGPHRKGPCECPLQLLHL